MTNEQYKKVMAVREDISKGKLITPERGMAVVGVSPVNTDKARANIERQRFMEQINGGKHNCERNYFVEKREDPSDKVYKDTVVARKDLFMDERSRRGERCCICARNQLMNMVYLKLGISMPTDAPTRLKHTKIVKKIAAMTDAKLELLVNDITRLVAAEVAI